MQDIFGHLAPPGKKVIDDNLRSLMFGNYAGKRDDGKLYDEIADVDKLKVVGIIACMCICACICVSVWLMCICL